MGVEPKDYPMTAAAIESMLTWNAEARSEMARALLEGTGLVIEQGWRTMETAPRDGTRFIAWWPPCAQLPSGEWHECQWHNGAWYHPFLVEPTHWQPPPVDGPHIAAALPAAPQEDKP